MNQYKKTNNIIGWIVFAIAMFVYGSTIEPTGSFWDCGEFIAASFKLQVGHPPGAPLFLMMGRVVTLLGGDNARMYPIMINLLSALMSALTILFLFWTITALARKIVIKDKQPTTANIIAVMGAGIVGALAYTFSDSFWFSAVEGEVYASSSFFTAIVFWAMFKWENVADEKHAVRWIILIAYLMGLSIGIHLLNLLTIPALAFIYYFRKYKPSTAGIIKTALLGILILGLVQYGIISGLISVASKFDLVFVNNFGFPFWSGVFVYLLIIIAFVILAILGTEGNKSNLIISSFFLLNFVIGGLYGGLIISAVLLVVYLSTKNIFKSIVITYLGIIPGYIIWSVYFEKNENKYIDSGFLKAMNTVVLCFAFLVIGYTSYTMVVVRSSANPPMDENDPENAFSLLGYLNREQYGDRPLFYGQYYNAKQIDLEEGPMQYTKGENKYVETGRKISPVYEKDKCTFLPRMYSSQENHIAQYKEWAGVKGDATPTFGQNLKFLFVYQIGHMYLRYFMWNFAGRQNDIQGHGGITKGNWISGIKFLDELRLGPQDKLPQSMLNNKGRNCFYLLPLILGIIGLIYHFKKDKHDAWVVLLLFFFTGIAIVLYLNGPPLQPRERDYAYSGSFYAFAIWIGLGVLSLIEYMQRRTSATVAGVATTAICLVAVPGIMAKDGWDDHNRAHRYTSRDFAWDYLQSCAPNAIIFTNGDNDTFPLWYAQEVEGVRPDIRIINLSLLNTDWYIDQMKRQAYQSAPVPFSLTRDKYMQGNRDYVPFYDRNIPGYSDLKDVIDFIGNDDPKYKVQTQGGSSLSYFPTKKVYLKVDKDAVLKSGTVKAEDASQIVDTMKWDIDKSYLMKADLMILDLLAHNNWQRPIYYAVTVGDESYLNLQSYFQLEGLAYRIVPIKSNETSQIGHVAEKEMYNNMMNKFLWGNMNRPDVYLDMNNLNMTMNFRNNFSRLAETLLQKNEKDSALNVLNYCLQVMPDKPVPYNVMMLRPIELYYAIGKSGQSGDTTISAEQMEFPAQKRKEAIETANAITLRMADIYEDDLNYYFSLNGTEYSRFVDRDRGQAMAIFQELARMSRAAGQTGIADKLDARFKKLEGRFGGS
jgi:hypothetical protein